MIHWLVLQTELQHVFIGTLSDKSLSYWIRIGTCDIHHHTLEVWCIDVIMVARWWWWWCDDNDAMLMVRRRWCDDAVPRWRSSDDDEARSQSLHRFFCAVCKKVVSKSPCYGVNLSLSSHSLRSIQRIFNILDVELDFISRDRIFLCSRENESRLNREINPIFNIKERVFWNACNKWRDATTARYFHIVTCQDTITIWK